jgi:hypothetical protein
VAKRLLGKLLKFTGATALVEHTPRRGKTNTDRLAREEDAKPLAYIEAYNLPASERTNLARLLDSGEGGVLREDLLPAFYSLALRTASQRDLIGLMQGYISEKHLDCLKLAMAADNLRKLRHDEAAIGLMRSASRKHGRDATKINNLYSAGYFASTLMFQRQWLWFEDARNAPERYRRWFEAILKDFHRAIFVGEEMTRTEIQEGISQRLCGAKNRQSNVAVWAAGIALIERTDNALSDWAATHPEYDYDVAPGHYGSAKAVRFVMFNKAANPLLRPGRLPRYWDEK